VTILLALMLWGALWGIVGMLLAVPITASLKILFERIDATHAVADLLAGRLSAVEG
jgi:AI-2 transport protein TqsA